MDENCISEDSMRNLNSCKPIVRKMQRVLPEKTTFPKIRTVCLGLLSFIVNLHGLTFGRTKWILRTDGSFITSRARGPLKHFEKPVLTLTFGIGYLDAFVNVVTSTMLMYGALSRKSYLLLPSLILIAANIVADISDALVATSVIANYIALPKIVMCSAVSVCIIILETFLWYGVLQLYEIYSAKRKNEFEVKER